VFRTKRLRIDTQSERVVFIHERAVREGNLGFEPLDRVLIVGSDSGDRREITGVLNFCGDLLVEPDEIGLSETAFHDLGLADGARVEATHAPPPTSIDRVRSKLRGQRLDGKDFDHILGDVVRHRYSKVELSMFVLACALRPLDSDELLALTRAMIDTGEQLDFGPGPISDKHCIGGVPGNRTTMVVVPILASLGLTVPKTSSRAITSPAGTADTMGVLAEVALPSNHLHRVVEEAGACIAWGGALGLAPADDILITVERPMEIDTETQMVASILAKKKTAGATHALIDIPVGPSAKIRRPADADRLCDLFRSVAREVELVLDLVITDARGPIGFGIGPRLEALDVLAVLGRRDDAPQDLREKSLYLAARILEMTGATSTGAGYRAAQQSLDSGAAEAAFERIVKAQGPRELPPPAPYRHVIESASDGRIRGIDCWRIARVAKQAGAPANESAGVRICCGVGQVAVRGQPLYEIHAQSQAQLGFARAYAEARPEIFSFGF
jgi:thymidine phosphorylase